MCVCVCAEDDSSEEFVVEKGCTEAEAPATSPSQRRQISGLTENLHIKMEPEEKTREKGADDNQERKKEKETEDAKRRQDEESWKYRWEEERMRRLEEENERKLEREKRFREEKEGLRGEAIEERQLRREELELRRRELELRERAAADERRERDLLLQLLSEKLLKK